jgi:hypothetical protein
VTKTLLPEEHLLARLLKPHLYLHLPLDFAVLFVNKSVAHNDQNELYTPFVGSKTGFFSLASAGYQGIKGNSSYPKFRYPLKLPEIASAYGRFLESYYRVIYAFVDKIVSRIPANDTQVAHWADCIRQSIPGFPSGRSIFRGDRLTAAVSYFICNVSVIHSADHHSFSEIPIRKLPLRLRVPPPAGKQAVLDRRELVSREDLFRHQIAREMYFRTSTITRLRDVDYEFPTRELQRENAEFRAELERVGQATSMGRFIPLEEIACSIQF